MAETGERAMVRDGIDPAAAKAAREGNLPPPADGKAGESDPTQPSRAEVLALRPDLADSVPGTPTDADHSPGTEAGVPGNVPNNQGDLP